MHMKLFQRTGLYACCLDTFYERLAQPVGPSMRHARCLDTLCEQLVQTKPPNPNWRYESDPATSNISARVTLAKRAEIWSGVPALGGIGVMMIGLCNASCCDSHV
eukprot:2146992-Amphidinium_carterae.1